MTALLDQALEAARSLSLQAHDDMARCVPRLAKPDDDGMIETLTQAEQQVIAASKAAARGDFATGEQVRAKHGL